MKKITLFIIVSFMLTMSSFAQETKETFTFDDILEWTKTKAKTEIPAEIQYPVEITCGIRTYSLDSHGSIQGKPKNDSDMASWVTIREGGIKFIACSGDKLTLILDDDSEEEYDAVAKIVPCGVKNYLMDDKNSIYEQNTAGEWVIIKEEEVFSSIECSDDRLIATIHGTTEQMEWGGSVDRWSDVKKAVEQLTINCNEKTYKLEGSKIVYQKNENGGWDEVGRDNENITCINNKLIALKSNGRQKVYTGSSDKWETLEGDVAQGFVFCKDSNNDYKTYKIETADGKSFISLQTDNGWNIIGKLSEATLFCDKNELVVRMKDGTEKKYTGTPNVWEAVVAPSIVHCGTNPITTYELDRGIIYKKAAMHRTQIGHGATSIFCSEDKLINKLTDGTYMEYKGTPNYWVPTTAPTSTTTTGSSEENLSIFVDCNTRKFKVNKSIVYQQVDNDWQVVGYEISGLYCDDDHLIGTARNGEKIQYTGVPRHWKDPSDVTHSQETVKCNGIMYKVDGHHFIYQEIAVEEWIKIGDGASSINCVEDELIANKMDATKEGYLGVPFDWEVKTDN